MICTRPEHSLEKGNWTLRREVSTSGPDHPPLIIPGHRTFGGPVLNPTAPGTNSLSFKRLLFQQVDIILIFTDQVLLQVVLGFNENIPGWWLTDVQCPQPVPNLSLMETKQQ